MSEMSGDNLDNKDEKNKKPDGNSVEAVDAEMIGDVESGPDKEESREDPMEKWKDDAGLYLKPEDFDKLARLLGDKFNWKEFFDFFTSRTNDKIRTWEKKRTKIENYDSFKLDVASLMEEFFRGKVENVGEFLVENKDLMDKLKNLVKEKHPSANTLKAFFEGRIKNYDSRKELIKKDDFFGLVGKIFPGIFDDFEESVIEEFLKSQESGTSDKIKSLLEDYFAKNLGKNPNKEAATKCVQDFCRDPEILTKIKEEISPDDSEVFGAISDLISAIGQKDIQKVLLQHKELEKDKQKKAEPEDKPNQDGQPNSRQPVQEPGNAPASNPNPDPIQQSQPNSQPQPQEAQPQETQIQEPQPQELRPQQPARVESSNPNPELSPEQEKAKHEQERKNLKADIEATRQDYLEAYYQKRTWIGKFKSALWDNVSPVEAENRSRDVMRQDLDFFKSRYDQALKKYQEFLVEEAKIDDPASASGGKMIDNKKFAEIAKIFNLEAKVELAKNYNELKAGKIEGRVLGWLRKASKGYGELVKKHPVMVGLTSLALVLTNPALGVGIGGKAVSVLFVKKMLVAGLTGGRVLDWAEEKTQKNREKEAKKDEADLEKELKGVNSLESLTKLNEKLDGIISQDKNRIVDTAKNKQLRNILAGSAVGGTLGFWILNQYAEKFFGADLHGSKEILRSKLETVTITQGSGNGTSFEQVLTKYVRGRESWLVDKYPDLKGLNTQQIVARISSDYRIDHHGGYPGMLNSGDKLKINFDFQQGQPFENGIRIDVVRGEAPVNLAAETAQDHSVHEAVSNHANKAADLDGQKPSATTEKVANGADSKMHFKSEALNGKHQDFLRWSDTVSWQDYSRGFGRGIMPDSYLLSEAKALKVLEGNPEEWGKFKEFVRRIRYDISGENLARWQLIGDMPANRIAAIEDHLSGSGKELFERFMNDPHTPKPLNGEPFSYYLRRAVRVSLEQRRAESLAG